MAVIVAAQPVRYGSTRMAKSKVMIVVLRGPTAQDPVRHRWHIACMGNRSHYKRDTGACVHIEQYAARMNDWHRARTWFLPFGDIENKEKRI